MSSEPGATGAATPRARGSARSTPVAGRGAPFVWLAGVGLALGLAMVAGLLLLVLWNGARTFWPRGIVELTLEDGTRVLGEVVRSESFRPEDGGAPQRRRLLRTGNFDLYGDDFRWIPDPLIASESWPADAWLIERREWGPAIGRPRALLIDGKPVAEGPDRVRAGFEGPHRQARDRVARIRAIEKGEIGDINHELEGARLETRKVGIAHGLDSAEHRAAVARAGAVETRLGARYAEIQQRIEALRLEDARVRIDFREAGGSLVPERRAEPDRALLLSQVIRAYPANALALGGKIRIYLARWWEFLSAEPREANTEGGVFPAIFGTFLMTVIMSAVVTPFGVIAALYLREYARQGPLVSAVRIAVNNLAGVPSIVFGVFGLGFFCYLVGGQIDQVFFPERLPAPTFGTGGILWASLTLALLTVPVVIVSTEEALASVPKSLREGSYACGASKWQTIQRIVLPAATPGILTGLILAMARGAGEVAPLMITGVVKLAPELPFDHRFPYFHLERSFMHLGFHIYDVGFQSRNSEAGKPMVFITTLLLIALVAVLNISAIRLRARLKARYQTGAF